MTTPQEPNEDRLDRIERILAEAAAAHKEEMAEIRAMVQANTATIAKIGERVAWLTEQQQPTNQDMSVIKGWQTELRVERNAPEIFLRLSPRGSLMRIYPKDELTHYITRGIRGNFITQAEADDAVAIDFLMEGTDHAGAPVMFAVEVSYTAGFADIERAVRRAPLLARMLGREAVLPAVAAEVISRGFEESARDYKISWAYVPNGNRIMQ